MTDYKPGLYAVTSWRGERQLAFRTERGEDMRWCVLDGAETRGLSDEEVRDARPLVVLDLDSPDLSGNYGARRANLLDHLRGRGATAISLHLADQIEAQTKPPRIPEPGLWGIVKAHTAGNPERRRFGRTKTDTWVPEQTATGYSWDELIDPALVREGVES